MSTAKLTKIKDTLGTDLRKNVAAMKNPQRALTAMGTVLVSLAKRSFNEPGVRALPWAPLAASTVREKQKKGYSEGILKRSGLLFRSPRVISTTNTMVTVGSDRPYAKYHQLGTKKMPARPIFPVTPDGKLTPQAATLVRAAATLALKAEIKG